MKVQRKAGPGTERLRLILKGVTDKVAKVGFFPSSKYPDGTPVAYVAAIQENGVPELGIPARPFMRTTVAEKTPEWRGIAQQGAQAIVAGNATGEQVLEALGLVAAGHVRQTISKISTPPLAEATIAARRRGMADKQTTGGLTKPLVHTGLLINSVSSSVEDKNG
jgi:hypothetical protein